MQRVNVSLGYMRPHIAQYVTAMYKKEKRKKNKYGKGLVKRLCQKGNRKGTRKIKIKNISLKFFKGNREGERDATHPNVLAGPCLVL